MDNLVLQTAIGLVFVFAAFALVISVITEAITRFLGLRGEYLLRGVRTLVDGDSHFELPWRTIVGRHDGEVTDGQSAGYVSEIMNHPLIRASADKGDMPQHAGGRKLSGKSRRKVPSYISAHSFSQALIDLIVPDAKGVTTMQQIRDGIDGLPPDAHLTKPLLALASGAVDDTARFRANVEAWYDAHMQRVSGWYKRHVRWISMAIGAVLAIVLNLSVLRIGTALYSDQAIRESVVTEAAKASDCKNADPAACLRALRQELDQAETAGLPIGWPTVSVCVEAEPSACNWWERLGLADRHGGVWHEIGLIALLLVGWVLMVLTLVPGARFWFDLLGRLGSLRASGPKPLPTPPPVVTVVVPGNVPGQLQT